MVDRVLYIIIYAPVAAPTYGFIPSASINGLYKTPPPIPTAAAIAPHNNERLDKNIIFLLFHLMSYLSNSYPSYYFLRYSASSDLAERKVITTQTRRVNVCRIQSAAEQ